MTRTLEIPERLTAARDLVAERIALLDDDARASLQIEMTLSEGERFAWQERKSIAFAAGHIDLGTASYLYRAIGEIGSAGNGGWPEGVDLVDQVVVTMTMGRIIAGR
jgi:hypothetical protein